MPQINLTGSGGNTNSPADGGELSNLLGPKTPGPDDTVRQARQEAEYENREVDLRKRYRERQARNRVAAEQAEQRAIRREAYAANQEFDLRRRYQERQNRAQGATGKADGQALRREAYAANQDYDLRQRHKDRQSRQQGAAVRAADQEMRRDAYRENDDYDRRLRLEQKRVHQQAAQERAALRSAQQNAKVEKNAEAVERRARQDKEKATRAEADYENRDRDAASRKEDRAYRAMRAEADYENRDRDRIQRRKDGEARAAAQKERKRALGRIHGAGLGKFLRKDESNIGTLSSLSGLAKIGGVIGAGVAMAAEAALAYFESPQVIAKTMSGLVAGAKPYRDLVYGSSDLGRQGGFDGQDLVHSWMPDRTRVDGTWRALRGLTTQDLTSISGAYGIASRSSASTNGIAMAAADANLAPFLGGLGPERYAQSLGLAQTLGVKGDGVMGMRGDPGAGGKDGASYAYMRDLQRTMTAATAAGMDHSQVMSGIEGMMRQGASLGAAEVNAPKTADAWWKMASSGSPGARTGDEQLSAQAGMAEQIESGGLGGGVVPNAIFHSYLARHGGMPKDAAGMAKMLGVDPSSMDPGEKLKFNQLVASAQHDPEAVTFEYAKSFMKGNGSEAWQRIVDGSGLAPSGTMAPLIRARMLGMPLVAYQDQQAGSDRPAAPAGGLGFGDVRDDARAAIYNASDETGVSASRLAALFSYETGGTFDNTKKSGTGAVGLGQITHEAIEDVLGMKADHLKPGDSDRVNLLYEKAQTDPGLNASLSARYYATLRKRWGSDHEALRHYHGMQVDKNGIGPDQYATAVEAREAGYTNDPHALNAVKTTESDLNAQAGKVQETMAETLQKSAPLLIDWNNKVDASTDAIGKWTSALLKSMDVLESHHSLGGTVSTLKHAVGSVFAGGSPSMHALASRGPLMP